MLNEPTFTRVCICRHHQLAACMRKYDDNECDYVNIWNMYRQCVIVWSTRTSILANTIICTYMQTIWMISAVEYILHYMCTTSKKVCECLPNMKNVHQHAYIFYLCVRTTIWECLKIFINTHIYTRIGIPMQIYAYKNVPTTTNKSKCVPMQNDHLNEFMHTKVSK